MKVGMVEAMTDYEMKKEALLARMKMYAEGDLMVAFSGGADSSLLLKTACEAAAEQGTKVYAVTVNTELHPVMEAEEARAEAEHMGALHMTLQMDELAEAGIENNPEDRCYRCKRYMFTHVKSLAAELGVNTVLEGTNADDAGQYRPGIRAVRELEISSPLLEAGMTKQEIRTMAAEYALAASDKPSTPCLATRFPYGTRLSREEMRRVETIEYKLHEMGFYNVRARVHGTLVRIEVDEKDIVRLAERRSEAVGLVKAQGYTYVSLDLEGFRSGSQDEEGTAEFDCSR